MNNIKKCGWCRKSAESIYEMLGQNKTIPICSEFCKDHFNRLCGPCKQCGQERWLKEGFCTNECQDRWEENNIPCKCGQKVAPGRYMCRACLNHLNKR